KNPTLLQCFHWYYPAGGELWREVTALAPNLNEIGINMIWPHSSNTTMHPQSPTRSRFRLCR
ncbi:hypothetical protein EGM92_14645, partial [Enterobacter cloacae]